MSFLKRNKKDTESEENITETGGKKTKKGKSKLKIKETKKKEKLIEKPIKLKSATGIKVTRYALWTFIAFLLFRGIVSITQPNPIGEMLNSQEKFEAKISKETLVESKAFSFAENFAKEYFTLFYSDKDEYKARLVKFMDTKVIDTLDTNGNMLADYVQAYNVERYSENQLDVLVYAKVQFKTVKEGQEGVLDPKQKQYDIALRDVYVKVPVLYDDKGNMIVEDTPIIIGAPSLANYKPEDKYLGKEMASTETSNAIRDSLNQFLKAYYQGDQTQVDYFLKLPGAIKSVGGGLSVGDIESIRVNTLGNNKYKAIVEYKVNNSGKEIKQKVNIDIVYEGDKYLIEKFDTRTVNIK